MKNNDELEQKPSHRNDTYYDSRYHEDQGSKQLYNENTKSPAIYNLFKQSNKDDLRQQEGKNRMMQSSIKRI